MSPEYSETPKLTFDHLKTIINTYQEEVYPYHEAMFINEVYDSRREVSEEDFEVWAAKFPRIDEEKLAALTGMYQETREHLVETLQLDSYETIDPLIEVFRQKIRVPRRLAFIVPEGKMDSWFTQGVLAMAKITGRSYFIQKEGPQSLVYEVKPTDTIEDLFPELRSV